MLRTCISFTCNVYVLIDNSIEAYSQLCFIFFEFLRKSLQVVFVCYNAALKTRKDIIINELLTEIETDCISVVILFIELLKKKLLFSYFYKIYVCLMGWSICLSEPQINWVKLSQNEWK